MDDWIDGMIENNMFTLKTEHCDDKRTVAGLGDQTRDFKEMLAAMNVRLDYVCRVLGESTTWPVLLPRKIGSCTLSSHGYLFDKSHISEFSGMFGY